MAYAEGTSVSIERSRTEIEKTLRRYGADAFSYGQDGNQAAIAFRALGRMVRLVIEMPSLSDPQIAYTPSGRPRSTAARESEQEKEVRRSWRALLLIIKAKLEAVESGIVSFEDEFAAYTLLPDGTTVGEWLEPQVASAYETGRMPSLLPGAAPQLTETT